jgi:hypothetical protein
MAWAGGTFTRANGANEWVTDFNNGVGIEPARHDTQDNDLATGINQCLNKDGSNSMTGNLNLNNNIPTNIGAGTAAAPAICAGGDVNTGIFSPSADNWAVATNGTERVRIDSTGKVGIGTNAPSTNLSIVSAASADCGISLRGNNTTAANEFLVQQASDGATTYVFNRANGPIVFGTNNAERMRISNTGNVGIGTNAPNGYLSVQFDGSADDFVAGRAITGANYVASKSIYDKTTVSAGNVAIEIAAGSYPLRRSTSSIKYKTEVVDLDPSYADKLHRFRPVFYKSKCFSDNPQFTHYGFIAEELAQIEPRFVQFGYQESDYEDFKYTDKDGKEQVGKRLKADAKGEPEGVSYDRIVTFLTSVVQRQEKRIAALETRIAELEK